MIAVSHPTGNEFVRGWVRHLYEKGKLSRFITCISADQMEWLITRLPKRVSGELRRRSFGIPWDIVDTHPLRESMRLIAQKLSLPGLTRHETGFASVDAVFRDLDTYAARQLPSIKNVRAVYCYEDGAEATFEAAGKAGLLRVYDLPIAYWKFGRALMREEAARLPNWEPTLVGTRDSQEKLDRKTREFEHADIVVCPSRFVLKSLPASAAEKTCIVSEFGSPCMESSSAEVPREQSTLRVLFAGSMTQRKGLADVFAAFKILKRSDVELVVLGSPVAPMEFYRGEYADFRHEPPRPHAEVLKLMRSCDVLVLPSILEGRALVQQEAMSCGLPLIVTANAGGEDLIIEKETGFLVPIRSPERIAESIAWMAAHRSQLPEMGERAKAHAARLTWESYAARILKAIESKWL